MEKTLFLIGREILNYFLIMPMITVSGFFCLIAGTGGVILSMIYSHDYELLVIIIASVVLHRFYKIREQTLPLEPCVYLNDVCQL